MAGISYIVYNKILYNNKDGFPLFPNMFSDVLLLARLLFAFPVFVSRMAFAAFDAFEEDGVVSADVGQKFLQSILSQGGTYPALELFKRFRKREPKVEPLLRHCGIGMSERLNKLLTSTNTL